MKYFSIDNFINKDLCEKLIQASDIHNFSKNKTLIHGQRQFISSSDEEFHNLLNNSEKMVSELNDRKQKLTDKLIEFEKQPQSQAEKKGQISESLRLAENERTEALLLT